MPRLACLASLIFLASLATAETPKSAWLHFRGPTGQGYSDDTRVPLKWSEKENILWKTPLPGAGNSSPIIIGSRVFLTAATKGGKERVVLCLSTETGKELWQKTAASDVPLEKTHAWNGYASPSCATDGQYVYAFFGTPGLFCYDVDGKLLWKKTFGVFASQAGWGTAATPFLYEDTVILNCDNDGGPGAAPASLVALDKKTGKQKWATPRNQGRGFSTPRLMKVAGRTDLVLNGPSGVYGYDPKTGKELWNCRRSASGDQHKFGEPLPVDDGKKMFILSGRPGPYQVAELPGEGSTKAKVIMSGDRKGNRDVSSPMLHNGLVYQVDSKNGKLTCYELDTGKEVFSGFLVGRTGAKSLGSPIMVQGKILWVMDEGTTVVVNPGRKLDVVAKNKLDGSSLDYGASPAVVDGKLYIRSNSHLYCVGEKK